MANASNPAATEMRIVPVVANAGSRSLSLSKLRIPIRYTREVKTGDDFLVRPPEEFNWCARRGPIKERTPVVPRRGSF